MSLTAAVVRELVAAGVTGDALVTACERIEAAATPLRSTGAERTARWRERNKKRHSDVTASQVTLTPSPLVPPLSPAPLSPPIIPPTPAPLARARPATRGSRLPADFSPIPAITELAKARGLTEPEIADQLERFRDWAKAATGQIGVKNDWQAAFRNWIKRAADDKKRKSGYGGKPSHGEAMRDAFDGLEAHIQGRGTAARY